jgi:hypothetical protein
MQRLGHSLAALVAGFAIGLAAPAFAEEQAATDLFPADQIEQMVAPVALYPDALIAQIMMASTYPLDVVQANRWQKKHEKLEGEDLQKAVDEQEWDESVKALVFFPSVLTFMSDNLDWTQDLGDAVLEQQADVTDAIQRLRGEAEATGALASNEEQRVEKAGDTIVIQPAQPEVVYVPSYDPVKVYGQSAPPAQSYYPDAYSDAMDSYAAGYAAGQSASTPVVTTTATETSSSNNNGLINFGLGAVAGGLLTAAIMWDDDDRTDRLYYGGPGYYGTPSYWSQPNYWNNNGWRQPANINVDRNFNVESGAVNINKGIVGNEINKNDIRKWEHNPERRGGVRYRDASTEKRFANKRKEVNIDRDTARGRVRTGDRQVKAPKLDQVKREGAASGKLDRLKDRGAGGSKVAQIKDKGSAADARAKLQAKAPAAKAKAPAVKAKIQAKAPAKKAAAKPRVKTAAAKRPVKKDVKRPSSSQLKQQIKRPAKTAKPAVKRASAARPKSSAFKAGNPKVTRAASHRGAASRGSAKAARAGGGAKRGGGARHKRG